MPVWSSWFIVLLKSSISLFIFCLDVLYNIESEILKSQIIIELFTSSFKSVNVCFIYLGALLFGAYAFIILIFP